MSKPHWKRRNLVFKDYELFGDYSTFDTNDNLILVLKIDSYQVNQIDAQIHWLKEFIDKNTDCKVYIGLIPLSIYDKYGLFPNLYPESNRNLNIDFYNKISTLVKDLNNCVLIDVEFIFEKNSHSEIFSNSNWVRTNNPFSWKGNQEYVRLIEEYIEFDEREPMKVLVLDFDNTIWGGVIGETDYKDISIGETGDGRLYSDFQRSVLEIRKSGVLLCGVSKNNESDVIEFFAKKLEMPLKLSDFVEFRANWKKKSENILEIANKLNLGLESFVFIDDSSFECQEVSGSLPNVKVCQFPKAELNYEKWFHEKIIFPYFSKKVITKEDFNRNRSYQARKTLTTAKEVDFERKITRHTDEIEVSTRLSQMTEKTNQFNINKKPMTLNEMQARIKSEEFQVTAYEYSDQFGDEGIVGLVILQNKGTEIFIEAMLLSCRVLGRGLEETLLSDAKVHAKKVGLPLKAILNENSRNIPVVKFIKDNLVYQEGAIVTL